MRYNNRKKIFDSKKKLKGKKIAIIKTLTVTQMKKLNEADEKHNFKNVLSWGGKICYSDGSRKIRVYYN